MAFDYPTDDQNDNIFFAEELFDQDPLAYLDAPFFTNSADLHSPEILFVSPSRCDTSSLDDTNVSHLPELENPSLSISLLDDTIFGDAFVNFVPQRLPFQQCSLSEREELPQESEILDSKPTLDRKRQRGPAVNLNVDRRKLGSRLQALIYLLARRPLGTHRPQFLEEQQWQELLRLQANDALVQVLSFKGNTLTIRIAEHYDRFLHALVNDGHARLKQSVAIGASSRFRWWSDTHFHEFGVPVKISSRSLGSYADRILEFPPEIAEHPLFLECYMYDQPRLLSLLAQVFQNYLNRCLHPEDLAEMSEKGFGRNRKKMRSVEFEINTNSFYDALDAVMD